MREQNYDHINIFPASKRKKMQCPPSVTATYDSTIKIPDNTICHKNKCCHSCCRCHCCKPKPPEKNLCCTKLIEHSTQLVPAAQKGSLRIHKEICAQIDKICDGVVVISGFLRKIIRYKTYCDEERVITDEVPFNCVINIDDSHCNTHCGDHFKIIEKIILCEVDTEEKAIKMGDDGKIYSFRLKERDVIKICIQKCHRHDIFDYE